MYIRIYIYKYFIESVLLYILIHSYDQYSLNLYHYIFSSSNYIHITKKTKNKNRPFPHLAKTDSPGSGLCLGGSLAVGRRGFLRPHWTSCLRVAWGPPMGHQGRRTLELTLCFCFSVVTSGLSRVY